MSKDDDFGDRMKSYEAVETERKFSPLLPVHARLDGRAFSKFTKGMQRPYDQQMTTAMMLTAAYLVEATSANIGYVQSDEISLMWYVGDKEEPQLSFFDGKIQKMTSVLASMAAVKFVSEIDPKYRSKYPHFDCRTFQVPSKVESANTFLWRAMDAHKNAISMVAQHYFSHNKLQGKSRYDMLEMLKNEASLDFYETTMYTDNFRYGTFIRKKKKQMFLTADEVNNVVSLFPNADVANPVERTVYNLEAVKDFNKVTNRVGFIFNGEDPTYV